MLQQDYLMRLIGMLIAGMQRNLIHQVKTPARASDDLEEILSDALDLDMSTLLTLNPDSFSMVMSVSGVDPRVVEYVARTLVLQAWYLRQAGDEDTGDLRLRQAECLMSEYGMEPFDPSYVPTAEELEQLALSLKEG